MGTLTGCIRKAGKALHAEDRAAVLDRFNELVAGQENGEPAAQQQAMHKDPGEAPEPATASVVAELVAGQENGEPAAQQQAMHKDPGEAPEPATASVVAEAITKAAKREDVSPAQMKAEALRLVDEAIEQAQGNGEIDGITVGTVRTVRGKGEITGWRDFPDGTKLTLEAREGSGDTGAWPLRLSGKIGKDAERGFLSGGTAKAVERQMKAALLQMRSDGVRDETGTDKITIKVPGDGAFTVVNTVDRLREFRKLVERSPGFATKQAKPRVERAITSGDLSPNSLAREMLAEGEWLNALEVTDAAGTPLMFGNGTGGEPIPYTHVEPIEIAGLKFFSGHAHSPKKGEAMWRVVHLNSGMAAGWGDTRADAVAQATKSLKDDKALAKVRQMDAGKDAEGKPFPTQADLRERFLEKATTTQERTFAEQDRIAAVQAEMSRKDRERQALYAEIMGEGQKLSAFRNAASSNEGLIRGFLNAAEKKGKAGEAVKLLDDVFPESNTWARKIIADWEKASTKNALEAGYSTVKTGAPPYTMTWDEIEPSVVAQAYVRPFGAARDASLKPWREAHFEAVKEAVARGWRVPDKVLYDYPSVLRDDLNDDQKDLAADAMVTTYQQTKDHGKALRAYREWSDKVDLKEFEREDSKGGFTLTSQDGDFTVLVSKTKTWDGKDRFQARLKNSTTESGPNLTEQQAIDWADVLRRDMRKAKAAAPAPSPAPAAMPVAAAPEAKPSAPAASTIESIKATMRAVYDGTASVDDYRAAFKRAADEAAVKADLGKMTKEDLIKTFGIMARPGEKKDSLVDSAYRSILRGFALGKEYGPNSYMMTRGGLEDYEKKKLAALTDLVEGQTAESLAAYAAEVKAERDEYAAKRAAAAASMKDPKTLDDKPAGAALKRGDGAPGGLDHDSAVRMAESLAADGLLKINVARSVAELPAQPRRWITAKAPDGNVRGAYLPGTDQIWIITDQIRGADEFVFVALHEAFHRGLAKTIPEAKALLREMHRSNAALRAATAAQMARHGIGEDEAIEEALADMAGKGEARDLSGFDRLLTLIREWLGKVARAAGIQMTWTDDMIADFVAGVRGEGLRGVHVNTGEAGLSLNREAQPFYSALRRAVTGAGMNAAPAAGWKQAIKGMVQAGKVKPDEVAWSGIEDWLDMQQGKVTRDAVVEFLSGNGVRVQETVLGDPQQAAADLNAKLQPFGFSSDVDQDGELYYLDANDEYVEYSELPRAVRDVIDAASNGQDGAISANTKYGQYTLPGGTNYREVLLTLPDVPRNDAPAPLTALPEGYEAIFDGQEPQGQQWGIVPPGQMHARPWAGRHADPEAARAAALTKLNAERMRNWKDAAPEYRSNHWDQPNVLAHIRVNDRTDADGKRVLFVEEIQSDWGQAAKKYGVIDQGRMAVKAEAKGEGSQLYYEVTDAQGRFITNVYGTSAASEQAAIEEANRRIRENPRSTSVQNAVPAAPFIGATDKWVALAIKRVIKMAVDEGYDRVAFVTGEQSAERYDLSKQVKSIGWINDTMAGGRIVTIKPEKGSDIDLRVADDGSVSGKNFAAGAGGDFAGKNLSDVIGKDLAEKVMAAKSGTLRGLDLKVGGEGMRAFYDKIVPSVAKDVLRKVGGGQMGAVRISSKDDRFGLERDFDPETVRVQEILGGFTVMDARGSIRTFDTRKKAEDYVANRASLTQPGFDITPKMREAAAGGLPMFSRRAAPSVEVTTDENGYPQIHTAQVSLIGAAPTERFEVIPSQGQEVVSYAITPAAGFDVLGHVELLMEGGRPVSLLDIEVYRDQGRRGGIGRATIEALLSAYPESDLNISNIVPEARGFWERMGIPQQNVEEGAAYDGTLNWQAYAAANPGAPGSGAQGRGGEGAGPDAGAASQDREGAGQGQEPRLSRSLAGTLNNARDIRLPANYRVGDLFDSSGVLHWWHKTVGTMHNLAERSPAFKRVYDAVQDFIDDVSFYATEAADLAPRLLPKLEHWRDVFKSPITPEESKAIAAPIFEGTLMWARGPDGKPVKVADMESKARGMSAQAKAQEMLRHRRIDPNVLRMWQGLPEEQFSAAVETRYANEMLKGGIVWTDAELRSMFGLTDGEGGTIELYKEFRKAVDRSLTHLALSDMLRFGGDDVAPLRGRVMASGDVRKAAEMLREHLFEMAEQDPERAALLSDTGNKMLDKAERAVELMERGYAPLSRFGQYTLDVVDKDGQRVYFGLFESTMERSRMARQMREQFPEAAITTGTMSQEAYKLFAGVSPETLELFGEFMGLEAAGDDASSKAFQEYIKLTKSTRSAMRRLLERKGIAGYSEDAGRVLAGFVYSNARQTSSNLHMGNLDKATADLVESKPDGQLADAALQLREYIKNPQEEAAGLRGLMFAQYLGGSVASAMVNMTQPAAVTFPYLSQFGGAVAAAKRLARAARLVNKKSTGDERLDRALKIAEEEGIVAPQEVHQLMAQAMGRATLRSGDGTKVGNAYATGMNRLSVLTFAWGKVFGMAEYVNRRMTFIAAYETAVAEKMDNPAEFAKRAVRDTQFVYNKGSKPRWARGAVGSVLFTFKQYSISYVELMNRLWNAGDDGSPERAAGRKAVMLALGVMLLAGGGDGLPFMQDAEDVIDGIMQRLGFNFSSKQAKREFLAKHLGEAGADVVSKGLSGLPGAPIDVSGRLGMGNLIPGTGLLVKKTDHTRDVTDIAGPVGDLATRAFKAAGQVVDGKPADAIKSLAPIAGANLLKAYDMARTGMYRDDRGRKVLDVDGFDVASKALGFQPRDVARVQQATSMVQGMIAQNKMRETEIADQWALGLFEKDQDKVADARAQLKRWNESNPTSPIRVDMAQILKRVRAMNQGKTERLAATAPREIRAQVKRELEAAK